MISNNNLFFTIIDEEPITLDCIILHLPKSKVSNA
jgi:hypothetical protein